MKPKKNMVCHILFNNVENKSSIYENLYFSVRKDYHKLFLASRIFIFRLTLVSIKYS